MLAGVLKKCLLILLVVVVYQHWGKIERLFSPTQVVSEQTQAKAQVVLYATEWCGYCKLSRRFLNQKGIPYKAFDIEKDAEARKAYEALGGGGAAPSAAAPVRCNSATRPKQASIRKVLRG